MAPKHDNDPSTARRTDTTGDNALKRPRRILGSPYLRHPDDDTSHWYGLL